MTNDYNELFDKYQGWVDNWEVVSVPDGWENTGKIRAVSRVSNGLNTMVSCLRRGSVPTW